jgi:hypothetical protein
MFGVVGLGIRSQSSVPATIMTPGAETVKDAKPEKVRLPSGSSTVAGLELII